MGDTASLRGALSQTDMSQPSIQASAAAMMKFYDKNAAPLAVSEWRSQLQTCRPDQLLPLLYVANEVLQISKRNRGPKFLEAFAEVLGSSLRCICERDRKIVEKVRRTTKIWGDRQVYSPRFIGQLLGGLEDLRGGGGGSDPPPTASAPSASAVGTPAADAAAEKKRSVTDDEDEHASDAAGASATNKMDADNDGDDDGDDDNEFSSPFGSGEGQSLLSIDITASAAAASGGGSSSKRRRSSTSTGASGGGAASSPKARAGRAAKKKKVAKSTSTMVSLLESLASLDDRYRSSCAILDSINEAHLNDADTGSLADVVGDELIDLNRGTAAAARTLKRQERALHAIANEKRLVEGEVAAYVPWLRDVLRADEEELAFCDKLQGSLERIGVVHAAAKERREAHRAEEAKNRAQEEAERKMREDEEERKRSLEKAMKAPAQEDTPNMKWNPVTREYQYVGDVTEESWRD